MGASVGTPVGPSVGEPVGEALGCTVGMALGLLVGEAMGTAVGSNVVHVLSTQLFLEQSLLEIGEAQLSNLTAVTRASAIDASFVIVQCPVYAGQKCWNWCWAFAWACSPRGCGSKRRASK